MKIPVYDLFSGAPEKEPLWLEAVEDLETAKERMKEQAREKPGPYFVYSSQSRAVVSSLDTSEKKTA